ncbi:MAG: hypothetical protein M1387_08480 [Thaumarchaeota archaeon]|nr:hypothetical protein [Nitrososphaerota archaeon]
MKMLRALIGLFSSRNEYGARCVTLQGERVKSKAEKIIADYFYRSNIKYEYEKVAKTHAWIFSKEISRPDFYLQDYDVYVEYWGLLDVENRRKRSEYQHSMRWKMAQYHKNKIKFVSLYPSNLKNLDWIFRTKFREVTGITLPKNEKA